MAVRQKIAIWFFIGVTGWIVGGLVVLAGFWEDVSAFDWIAAGTAMSLGGLLAMLVSVIAKGVELGVRAANDE